MEDTNIMEAPTQIMPVVEDRKDKTMKKREKEKGKMGTKRLYYWQ